MDNSEKILRRQWRTEQKFFDVLNKEFHFQLDAAASKENAKCPLYYTEQQDSLSDKCPWITEHCRSVFVNPGFNNIGPWCEKASKEVEKFPDAVVVIISLISPSATWWKKWVTPHAKEIRLIGGKRIQFEPPHESIKKSSNARENCVIIYRSDYVSKNVYPPLWVWEW